MEPTSKRIIETDDLGYLLSMVELLQNEADEILLDYFGLINPDPYLFKTYEWKFRLLWLCCLEIQRELTRLGVE